MLCVAWFLLVSTYYVVLLFAALRAPTRDRTPPVRELPRILVLVPAHNEQLVINGIVDDLGRQTYERGRYRALVVADHCSDDTEQVARRAATDIVAVVRREEGARGKGAALEFGLRAARDAFPDFDSDYVAVFDADNRVEEAVLETIADHAAAGHPAIQIQVRTKNPETSLLAKVQALEFTVLQRVWQGGKDRLGLVNAFAGTGQAIERRLLESAGGFQNSLTDDLDLTIRLARRGVRIKYIHAIATYDEKPDDLVVEIGRRVRWSAGHLGCLFRHGPALLRQRPDRLTLDALLYLLFILTPLVLWASYGVTVLAALGLVTFTAVPVAVWAFLSFSWPMMVLVVPYLERETGLYRAAPAFFLFLLVWMIAVPWGLAKVLRRDSSWRKTPHRVTAPPQPVMDRTG